MIEKEKEELTEPINPNDVPGTYYRSDPRFDKEDGQEGYDEELD